MPNNALLVRKYEISGWDWPLQMVEDLPLSFHFSNRFENCLRGYATFIHHSANLSMGH